MSEMGNRIRDLFVEIAPPIDVDGIVKMGGVRVETRRGWLIAVAAAALALVLGAGSFLLFGGSDRPADVVEAPPITVEATQTTSASSMPTESTTTVEATQPTSASSTPTESTTTVPANGFVPRAIRPFRIICTSELPGFPCSALIDGDEITRWNAVDGGVGAEITLLFDAPVQITSIDLINTGDPEAFARNARIRGLEISFDDLFQAIVVELDDTYFQSVPVESLRTTAVTFRVTSAYPGEAYEGQEPFSELALAEIQVWGAEEPSIEGTEALPQRQAECSAGEDHKSALPQSGLPGPVAETRNAIVGAAGDCDYEALDALAGAEGSPSFGYDLEASFESPAALWSAMEELGYRPTAVLVDMLNTPYRIEETDFGRTYVWPVLDEGGNAPDPRPAVGISEDGRWVFLIFGDRLMPEQLTNPTATSSTH